MMDTVQKAWKTVKSNNPGMKVYISTEVDDYYVFSLIPEDLAEDDGFGCSGVHIVDKKTGEYKTAHFTYVINRPILREFDPKTFE